MNVRSPITWLLLLGMFTTGIFIACHKEVNQPKRRPRKKKPLPLKRPGNTSIRMYALAMTLRQQRQTAGKNLGKLYPIMG